MAKRIEKEVLLQQTVQKTEILAQTQTYRKNIVYSLTLDNSGSMLSKKKTVLTAAYKIFNKLGDHDRLEFALFGASFKKLHGPKKKMYVDWNQNKEKFLCDENSTALNGSICAAIDQFPRDVKYKGYDKVMVVLTDGEDNVTREQYEPMIAKLKSFPIPNCKFFLIGVGLSERAKVPYRVISSFPGCSFLEADQVDQVAAAFKEISKTIFIKRTTTVHIDPPSRVTNNNRSITNNNGIEIVHRDRPATFVTVSTTILKKPCHHFAKGYCRDGDSCKYSHDNLVVPVSVGSNHSVPQIKASGRVKEICWHFNSPTGCGKGSNCPYPHEKENTRNGNKKNKSNNNKNKSNNNNNNNQRQTKY